MNGVSPISLDHLRPDAVPKGIAGGQGDTDLVAMGIDLGERIAEGAAPLDLRAIIPAKNAQMPEAADQYIRFIDDLPAGLAEPRQAVCADADHMKPRRHGEFCARLCISALTAAAASALPPLRPRSVTNGTPSEALINASLLSSAPTNPTGKARMASGSMRH